jgi:SAM-dependent methyltransferase
MDSTIDAYEQKAFLYRDHTDSTMPTDLTQWLNASVSGLSPSARIFEIGSGTGRDASYLKQLGYRVQVSDVASSFVSMLAEDGWDAIRFDVVKDDLTGTWDLVFADAVLLHLTRDEFSLTLEKILASLEDNGRFAFTLKAGDGEAYSSEKLGMPRFFCYWQTSDVEDRLGDAGYSSWAITEHPGWIHVVASK